MSFEAAGEKASHQYEWLARTNKTVWAGLYDVRLPFRCAVAPRQILEFSLRGTAWLSSRTRVEEDLSLIGVQPNFTA